MKFKCQKHTKTSKLDTFHKQNKSTKNKTNPNPTSQQKETTKMKYTPKINHTITTLGLGFNRQQTSVENN